MDKENNNDDSIDVTAILNRVVDKIIYKKAEAYVQKELSAENILKHFEVVCTEGYTLATNEDFKREEENRKNHPVRIDGLWLNIWDIDRPSLKRRQQLFYDQIVNRAFWGIYKFMEDLGFWGIRKYYKEIVFMFSCLLELCQRNDYEKRTEKAITNLHYKPKDEQFYNIKLVIINPLSFDCYCKKLVIESFEKDAQSWNNALSNYKRKNAYINRLHYLIEQMDELEKLEIPFLKERIANQKEQYLKLLSE